MARYNRVLVLTEGKQDAKILLPYAVDLQAQFQCDFMVAHLANDIKHAMAGLFEPISLQIMQETELKQDQMVISQLTQNSHTPFQVKEILVESLTDGLAEYVRKYQIDLLVVGFNHRFLAGLTSSAFDIINHIDIDVLVKQLPKFE